MFEMYSIWYECNYSYNLLLYVTYNKFILESIYIITQKT